AGRDGGRRGVRQRLEGDQPGFAGGRARQLFRPGGADRRRPRQGSGLPAAGRDGPAGDLPRDPDRGGGRPDRGSVERGPNRAGRIAGRGGRDRARPGARQRKWAPDRSVLARMLFLRYVPGLRGPWTPLQGGGPPSPGQGGPHVNRGDRWLLILPLALTAWGVVMVYSSSAILGITRYQDPDYFLVKQMIRAGLGVTAMLACAKLRLRALHAAAPWLYGMAAA